MSSSLSDSLKVLRCSPSCPDPAIDTAAMQAEDPHALSKYVTTRVTGLLRLVDGVPPCWFHLRRLPLAWLTTLDGIFPQSEQRVLAFRASCHAIEHTEPLTVSPHGTKGARFEATREDRGVSLAPAEWAQEVCDLWGAEVVQEIGSVAIAMSRLPRGAHGPFAYWGGSVLSG